MLERTFVEILPPLLNSKCTFYNEPHQACFPFFSTSSRSKRTFFFKLLILNYDYMNILGL